MQQDLHKDPRWILSLHSADWLVVSHDHRWPIGLPQWGHIMPAYDSEVRQGDLKMCHLKNENKFYTKPQLLVKIPRLKKKIWIKNSLSKCLFQKCVSEIKNINWQKLYALQNWWERTTLPTRNWRNWPWGFWSFFLWIFFLRLLWMCATNVWYQIFYQTILRTKPLKGYWAKGYTKYMWKFV